MSANIVSAQELPIINGVGTVAYEVFGADGTSVVARTNAGVVLLRQNVLSGVYQAEVVVPNGVVSGTVVWDDNSGNIASDPFWIGPANAGSVTVGAYSSTLDATWGGLTADSYVSLADTETMIQNYVFEPLNWTTASGQKKDAALRMATRQIDMHNFYGRKRLYNQPLQWPRWQSIYLSVTLDDIFRDIQLATVFQAASLINRKGSDRHAQNIQDGLRQVSESVGPIRDQYTYNTGGPMTIICADANRILTRYVVPKYLYRA